MAQEGTNNNALPAANVDSMVSGDKKEGTGESQAGNGNQPAVADKGKGVAGNVDEGGSKGKSTATAAASSTNAPNQGRAAAGGGGRSRERMHIFAERERRRKIKNMFTDLRDLVPSLTNKADKATIVGEAISFIRSLEETVTDLESRKRERDSLTARCACLCLGGSSSSSAVAAPPPASAVVAPVTPVVAHGRSMPPAAPTQAGADGGGTSAPVVLPVAAAAAPAPAEAPAPGTFMVWSGPSVVLNLCGGDQAFINVSVARRPGVLTMIVDVLERHSIDVVTVQIASDQSRSLFTIHTRVDRERGMFMDSATSEEIYQLAVSEVMVWLHSE